MSSDARVVIVTGGAYGIGRGIAHYFAGRGDAVLIADVHAERGQQVEAAIRQEGGRALFVRTDLRDEPAVRQMVERAAAEWGRIDVLCNNAGIEFYGRADEYSTEDWAAMVDVNFRGVFLCSKYAFPHLRERRGSIVNIASVQGFACDPRVSIYAATKAGVLGLTRGMALDFAPAGVRVNAICPGATRSGMLDELLAMQPEPEAALASMCATIPMGRLGEPEDIARAVWFLASPDAGYITGTSLVVDGGLLARLAI